MMIAKREKPFRSQPYRAAFQFYPCVVPGCGCPSSECAHIRIGFFTMARKPSDDKTVPLCSAHHRIADIAQHNHSEREWWALHGIDPFEIAAGIKRRWPDTAAVVEWLDRMIRTRKAA